MADTLQFDLVSPERKLASVAATSVQIPGIGGDLTALPNHAPFLTTLRPGVVRVVTPGETTEYVVTGGFAEVSPTAASILAEQAVLRPEADATLFTPPLDPAKVYAGFNVSPDSDATIVNSTRVLSLPAPKNVTFGCIVSITDTEPLEVAQPLTVAVQQISGNAAGSSTPLPVSRAQARAAAAATR